MKHFMLNKRRPLPARRALVMALLAATSLAHPAKALAQVKSANSATTVIAAPNGVPVVNIANPNGAGLSDNKFTDYNVGTNGLILNNGDSSQAQRQSQLGGAVSANQNLSHSASVILNEVVSTNRSEMDGFTEVLGTSADVVVANPNGITCNGCGFINTPHVTLTTGNPVISSGGALTGFHVDNGDILITGGGIDASKQDYLGLIARSVAVYGQINAKQLDVVAGPNDFDYATGAVTAHAASGTAPTLAIDSSALGGMYADRIRLVATEAGVGVRVLGDAAAGTGDFTLDGAGKIEVGGHVSSAHDVKITTTDTSATDAIKTTNAHLTATHDLLLTASGGNVDLVGGALYAGNDLTIASDSLTDEGSSDSAADNNTRYAAGNLTLTSNGIIFVGNTTIGTAGTLTATGGAFDVDNGSETIYGNEFDVTTTGQISLNTASVKIQGDINLTSTASLFVDNLGAKIQSAAGHIDVTSAGSFTNSDAMSADTGDITIRSNNTIQNTGTLHAGGILSLADSGGNGGEIVQNYGILLADNTLNVNATTLNNYSAGSIQGTQGSTFTLGTLSNDGILIASANSADSGTINADTLTNTSTGTIQSAKDLTLNVSNTATNSNKILATGTLSLLARTGATLAVTNNTGAYLQAGGALTIAGLAGGHNASIGTQNGNILGNSVSLTLSSLTNSGIIQSTNGLTLSDSGGATNNSGGKLLAGTSFTLGVTGTLADSGVIQEAGGGTITAGTLTVNSGGVVDVATDAASSGTVTATTLTDNGGLQSEGGMTLNVSGTLTDGNGVKLFAGKNLTISAGTLTLGNSSSQIIAGNSGSGTGSITLSNALTNPGFLYSKGDLSVSAPSITNSSTGGIAAAGTLHAHSTGGDFSNYGSLYAGTLLDVQAPTGFATFINEDGGVMYGGTDITASAYTFTNYNSINANHNLTITSTLFYNEVPGGDQRNWTFGTPVEDSGEGWSNGSPCSTSSLCTNNTYYYHTFRWADYESYTVAPTHGATLVAGNTLSIQNFLYGENLGSVISGNTVNMTGQSGATFINDDYSLSRTDYIETYYDHGSCDGTLCFTYSTDYGEGDTTSHTDSSTASGLTTGIYATTLNASGFGLTNISSPYAASGTAKSGSATGSGASSGTSGATAANTVSFGGITITLPTNPNGFFVVSKDPNSKYLIETNPMYSVGSSFLGSDYMLDTYGVDPDTIERRLGDANYEASLIRQQILNDGAAALLTGSTDEGAAMQKLMDNGDTQGKKLGLVVGTAPTSAQLASLGSDIVWMVDTVVDSQHVLAPVVYLSAATKSQIASGAVIQSVDANLQLASLNNTGGTITGSNSLNLTTQGDITNTSGTIGGGNVSLTSTNGSIISQTVADTSGGDGNQQTSIGKTAGIVATGDLSLNANQNIANTGANMGAGGNASLTAGNNITFDTVTNNQSSTTHNDSGDGSLGSGSHSETTTSSTTNIKSGLTVGGNLTTNSGNDTTFAGTDVNVGGNADLKTGGNLNIIARNDSTETNTSSSSGTIFSGDSTTTHDKETTNVASNFNVGGNLTSNSKGDTTIQGSNINVTGNGSVTAGGNLNILDGQNTSDTSSSSTHTGAGVGGGVYGTSTTTDTDQKGTSVASNLNFGGNASLNAGNTLTVQGSNVGSGGNMDLNAQNVNILEGRNTETTTHTESTTTFGKIDNGGGYEAPAAAPADAPAQGGVNASADANASAGEQDNGGVTLSETDINSTTHDQSHAVGSNITSGGNMTINAGNDVTVRGSNVSAGGDATINAQNVNVLAATDTDTTTTSNTTSKTGLYGSTSNQAGADANANAHAEADGNGSPEASANADANASAANEDTLDLERVDQSSSTTTDITHTGSTIHSGGNLNVNAANQLNVNGSALDSGGDMNLNAKDMSFTAANDSHTVTTTDSHTRAGLYADAGASADANAGANAQGISAGGSAGANADANAGIGLYGSNTTNSAANGTTTAQTSSLHSGGNMTRTATGDITDEGTQVDAGGNFTQSSTTWESKAAQNTTSSTSSSTSNSAKLGLYADANAGASGSASTMSGTDNDSGADASVGVSASYNRSTDNETSNSSNAVVSNIHSGGNMTTTTTGKTSLEGTNLNSGGDTTLNAGSLDYKAAQNTSSSSSNTSNIDAGGKIGLDASKEVTVGLNGGYGSDNQSQSSTTAVTGSMTSGGNLHVNTTGDANFEGTNLNAGGDAGVKAGGNVNFTAAHNTSTSSDTSLDASASLSLTKGKGGDGKSNNSAGLDASAEYGTSSSSESDAVTGSITSGGKLDVSAGKNATFEGTQLASGGDTSVSGGGDVNFKAAQSTSSSSGWNAGGSLSLSKGGTEKGDDGKEQQKGTSGGLSLDGGYNSSNATTSTVASINSGGKVNVKSGNDVNLEGTNITSADSTTLDAGHNVNFTAATNTSSSIGVSGSLGGTMTSPAKTEGGTASGEKKGTEKTGEVGLDVSGGTSTTKTGGSINAGSINIKSGNDTNLEGTQTQSAGDTTVSAGGNVNLTAAQSSSVEGGIGGGVGSEGGGLTRASIGGGVDNQGVGMKSGGDMNITSGGTTTMQGTQIAADGNANIDAKGGLDKQTTVSGGADLGLDHAGANASIQTTQITAKGNTIPPPSADFQKALAQIKNDPSLSPAQKTQMMTDKIKNDPTLTAAQKAKLLADLAKAANATGP